MTKKTEMRKEKINDTFNRFFSKSIEKPDIEIDLIKIGHIKIKGIKFNVKIILFFLFIMLSIFLLS